MAKPEDKLTILWTSDDLVTAEKMVFMYALNAKKLNWWQELTVIIWGASTQLMTENIKAQSMIKTLIEEGVHVSACKACADQLKASGVLEAMGVEVKYWGEPLTEILKSNGKLLTI